jgi:predicted exporter
MKAGWHAAAWLAAWLAALGVLLGCVGSTLRVGTDLRLFLPPAATLQQRVLLEGIGEGPVVRQLLVALEGDDPARLAAASRSLAARLRESPAFDRVANGAAVPVPPWVSEYRYLLSPEMDHHRLDAETLRAALEERLQDLASPASSFVEPLVASDPTLETLAVAEHWLQRSTPRLLHGVWFDAAGRRALLSVETAAAGFDPDRQQRSLDTLEAAFGAVRDESPMRMTVTGPGRFAALMKEKTQREATWLGAGATAILLVLLFFAYRRALALLLATLPLATAGLSGLACISLSYGEVHGITLGFGFTLIGVAQDYPIHLLSHQRRGLDPLANARALWRTLATGIAATCVAYLAFIASGVAGLAQLGWFTVSGLAVAGLATRYLLPRISGEDFKDTAGAPWLGRVESVLTRPAFPPAAQAAFAAACVLTAVIAPGPFWDNDLAKLTPVPPALLATDAELRRELRAPDARHLAVVSAPTHEQALRRLEDLTQGLEGLVARGAIAGFDHMARYLPSMRRQRSRQDSLPGAAKAAADLAAARQGLPYRNNAFDPFLRALTDSRALEPLTPEALAGTDVASVIEALSRQASGTVQAFVTFADVRDPARIADWAQAAGDDVVIVDLKRESEALVARQRGRILLCLAFAAALLVVVVRASLGDWQRTARVVAPMVLSTVAVIAALRLVGEPLNLFHLVSLVLSAGLGLDYSLFFERSAGETAERLRTLHGLLVCAASTLAVFVLLSLSTVAVLRTIGLTVALGVAFNFLLALSLSGAHRTVPR